MKFRVVSFMRGSRKRRKQWITMPRICGQAYPRPDQGSPEAKRESWKISLGCCNEGDMDTLIHYRE
jgi:hypothetical protein